MNERDLFLAALQIDDPAGRLVQLFFPLAMERAGPFHRTEG
jgi:hypothetical protein